MPRAKKGRTKQPHPWRLARDQQAHQRDIEQRRTRHLTPGLRDMLAAWDSAVQAAKDRYVEQDRAYREANMTRNLADDAPESSPSPAWQTVLDGLANA